MKRVLALAVLAAALCASAAEAHLGNSNYRDVIDRLTPSVPGVSVQVLNFDNNLELDNHSGRTVVIYGYTGDQYARLLADGTVQVNQHSPAFYLNDDRYATTVVPPSANAKAAPQWVTIDQDGPLRVARPPHPSVHDGDAEDRHEQGEDDEDLRLDRPDHGRRPAGRDRRDPVLARPELRLPDLGAGLADRGRRRRRRDPRARQAATGADRGHRR